MKYSIPLETLSALVAPVQAMEEAVLAQLEQHPELFKPFFQYNSPNDRRLIWAFYHLIAEQQTEILSQPETLRHLIALTLNRGSELPPEVYFERYQQLLALCTPVLQAHEAALQAEFDAAAAQTRAALAGGTHRLHAAVRDAASCTRPDGRLPQRRFFQRHRPVSRHDLPPHELARVRRVHPRGQAEPAQLQP